jgi:hypothetical protein
VQADPVVVYTGAKYVVAWCDSWSTGGFYWITTACVDTAGVVIDTGGFIGAQAMRGEYRPDIAFDNNRCLVTWYNNDAPFGVYGRFVDDFGLPEDTVFKISSTLANYNINPSIVFAGDRYLLAWADKRPGYSDLDITAQFVSVHGELIGQPLTIATGPSNQLDPAVTYDGSVLLVTWCDDPHAIFGQKLHPDGTLISGNFMISDNLSDYRSHASVDASASNFLVVWSEIQDGETDIFGNVDTPAPIYEGTSHVTSWRSATFFGERIELPYAATYCVYDVCGRDVTNQSMTRGIYFIETEDHAVQKVIKVR